MDIEQQMEQYKMINLEFDILRNTISKLRAENEKLKEELRIGKNQVSDLRSYAKLVTEKKNEIIKLLERL